MEEKNILKYLSGTLTDDEKKEFNDWLNESLENQKMFFDIKTVWHARKMYSVDKKEMTRSLQELNKSIDTQVKKKRSFAMWLSVAAVSLILVAFSVFFGKDAYSVQDTKEMITFYNQSQDTVLTVILPDGSTVWLSQYAKIEYPEVFDGAERLVILDGEAFFDVKSDPSQPFIVKVNENLVKVLGTTFSVNSNARNNTNEVILLTGVVQVQHIGGEAQITLHPGQKSTYYKDSQVYEINEVDAYALTSWRYGIVMLDKVSINDLIQSVEKDFQVKINMKTEGLENKSYNFSYKKSKGVESVLHQIELITNRSISIR